MHDGDLFYFYFFLISLPYPQNALNIQLRSLKGISILMKKKSATTEKVKGYIKPPSDRLCAEAEKA